MSCAEPEVRSLTHCYTASWVPLLVPRQCCCTCCVACTAAQPLWQLPAVLPSGVPWKDHYAASPPARQERQTNESWYCGVLQVRFTYKHRFLKTALANIPSAKEAANVSTKARLGVWGSKGYGMCPLRLCGLASIPSTRRPPTCPPRHGVCSLGLRALSGPGWESGV